MQPPLWVRDISGQISYRIERYLCDARLRHLPPTPQPVIVVHFGGKKISRLADEHSAVSFPGMTTVLPGNRESVWEIKGALDIALLYFQGGSLQQLQHNIGDQQQPVVLNGTLCGALVSQLTQFLADETLKTDPAYIDALSNALLHQLCYQLAKPEERISVESVSTKVSYVNKAIRYIHDNLSQPLKANDIAAVVGLHQSHFRQIFQHVSGLSLHRYVLQTRVARARELVSTSNHPLAAIAQEVGFSSQSHMTTCFRRYYDVTPSVVRRGK